MMLHDAPQYSLNVTDSSLPPHHGPSVSYQAVPHPFMTQQTVSKPSSAYQYSSQPAFQPSFQGAGTTPDTVPFLGPAPSQPDTHCSSYPTSDVSYPYSNQMTAPLQPTSYSMSYRPYVDAAPVPQQPTSPQNTPMQYWTSSAPRHSPYYMPTIHTPKKHRL